jgi:hypothetical protein
MFLERHVALSWPSACNAVRKIIEEYASYKPSHGHIETEAIIDSVKEHERGSCGRAV